MTEATLTRFEARAMGSALRLTLGPAHAANDAVGGEAAWAEVVDEFERSEQAMSRFRDGSELTALNRAAGTGLDVPVGRRLVRAVVAADRAHRMTHGTFDPRVLGDLVRLGYGGAVLPGSGSAAPPRADDPIVCCWAPGRLRVDHPIDLGGIGKGLALRWAAGRLESLGLRSYLLEAGGDLIAHGAGPGGNDWRVGIEHPSGGGSPLAVIGVRDLAVTTSSVGVHVWVVDGRPVHHLLDPATGQSGGDGLLAATVAAPDPAWAEVWSKTLFLAGRTRIAHLARARGLTAWWVPTDGRLEMTPAARLRTVWVAAES